MKTIVSEWTAGAAIILLTAALLAPTPRGDEVAAIFPPWWRQDAALAAAASAGQVLAVGGVGFVFVVRAPKEAGRERLRRAGALALLDAQGLTGCAHR